MDGRATVPRNDLKDAPGLHGTPTLHGALQERYAEQRSIPSVAVLPFLNLSDDGENDYFSDGLAEEILNDLTQSPGLRVIAH
jgi:TolB-like protein